MIAYNVQQCTRAYSVHLFTTAWIVNQFTRAHRLQQCEVCTVRKCKIQNGKVYTETFSVQHSDKYSAKCHTLFSRV